MLGAIIGDIVGSRFEFNNTNKLDFELFTPECSFTDDTICTIAIANALTAGNKDYKGFMHRWCNTHPHPMGGYGGSFARWVASTDPQPYNSFGNGSAMRVAAIGWWFDTLEEVQHEAEKTALPTHNHPEGIKGAVATATAIYLARKQGKDAMLEAMKEFYPTWVTPQLGANPFNETCQGTLPIVFGIINHANNFEEALRYAIVVGGDSDTIGAIVGSIAEAIWGIPENIAQEALHFLPETMHQVINDFYGAVNDK
jgi:ADP-ribosylglycohydrolase